MHLARWMETIWIFHLIDDSCYLRLISTLHALSKPGHKRIEYYSCKYVERIIKTHQKQYLYSSILRINLDTRTIHFENRKKLKYCSWSYLQWKVPSRLLHLVYGNMKMHISKMPETFSTLRLLWWGKKHYDKYIKYASFYWYFVEIFHLICFILCY